MVITDKTCVGAELVGSAAGDSGSGAAVVVGVVVATQSPAPVAAGAPPLAAEMPAPTNPTDGLHGMMVPTGAGS